MAELREESTFIRLKADNYYAWSVRTRAILENRGCWSAIEPGFPDISDVSLLNAAQKKENDRARSFLITVVSDCYLDDIGGLELARDIWYELESLHCQMGIVNSLMLLKELVMTRKDGATSM